MIRYCQKLAILGVIVFFAVLVAVNPPQIVPTDIPGDTGAEQTFGASVLNLRQGGTGLSTYSAGDMVWASSSAQLFERTTIGSSGQCWTVTGATTLGWGGCGSGTIQVRETGGAFANISSIQFEAGHFNVTNAAPLSTIKLDWTNGPASRSSANTWTALNIFSVGASISPTLEIYNTIGTASLELFANNDAQKRFFLQSAAINTRGGVLNDRVALKNDLGSELVSVASSGDVFFGLGETGKSVVLPPLGYIGGREATTFTAHQGSFAEGFIRFAAGSDPVMHINSGENNTFQFTTDDKFVFNGGPLNIAQLASASLFYTGNGTAASPSYSFRNSQGMGLFSVSKNNLGFATGGTERFRADSVGRLQFPAGTTRTILVASASSPAQLTVQAGSSLADSVSGADLNLTGGSALGGTGGGTAQGGGVNIYGGGGADSGVRGIARLAYNGSTAFGTAAVGGAGAGSSLFAVYGNAAIGSTYAAGSNNNTNGFIVEGNVGIGTTTPAVKLQIVGAASISSNFEVGGYASLSNSLFASSGNVGIGNRIPDVKLDVTGNIAASTSGNVDIVLRSSTTNGASNNNDSQFTLRTAGAMERLSIHNGAGQQLVSIASGGFFNVGLVSPSSTSFIGGVKEWSATNAANYMFAVDSYGDRARFQFRRANGTIASPTALVNNDVIFAMAGRGYGATGFGANNTGGLLLQATENWTDSSMATKLLFGATPSGANIQTNYLTLFGNGLLEHTGVASVSGAFETSGKVVFSGVAAGAAGDTDACFNATTNELTDAGASTCIVSSRRYKENIKELSGSLEKVLKLNPVSFTYKPELDSSIFKGVPHIGLIAEEVAEVEPRLVSYEKDGKTPRTVNYEESTALLAGAIQELDEKVENSGVVSLQTQLDQLSFWQLLKLLILKFIPGL